MKSLRAVATALLLVVCLSGAAAPSERAPLLALLAPTTGKQAAIGQRVVALVAMALEGRPVRVQVFDTGPSASAAAQQAVDAGASLVLGPVGALETAEVAGALAPSRLSMVSLSGVDGLEDAPRRLRGRVSRGDELRSICRRLADRPPVRVALLVPDGPEGDEAAAQFTRCMTASDRPLAQLLRLGPLPRDAGRAVEALAQGGGRLASPGRSGAAWPEPPKTGRTRAPSAGRPEVLVAVATAAQGSALLPALGIRGWFDGEQPLRIYGTGEWEGPELATAAAFLSNLSVVERCAWSDPRDVSRAFADRFEARFGEPPTRFDAEVFDAVMQVEAGRATLPSGVASPERWAEAILRAEGTEGVCGDLSWSKTGAIDRPLPLWSVDGDGALYPRAAAWDD